MAHQPVKVAPIALANKIARITWALMASGTRNKEPVQQAERLFGYRFEWMKQSN